MLKFFQEQKAIRIEREKAQIEVSVEFYNFHNKQYELKRKSINGFFKYYVISNEETENLKNKHNCHFLLQFIREWKRAMPSIRIENDLLNKNVNEKIKGFQKVNLFRKYVDDFSLLFLGITLRKRYTKKNEEKEKKKRFDYLMNMAIQIVPDLNLNLDLDKKTKK